MEWQAEDRTDLMGQFHNAIIGLVDSCKLSPPETVSILRMVAGNIEKLFETAVKAPKPKKKEESDGGGIQEAGV
jgi:hypothetical protein